MKNKNINYGSVGLKDMTKEELAEYNYYKGLERISEERREIARDLNAGFAWDNAEKTIF